MKAFRVRGIVWEIDGKRPALPGEATIECESEADIADALSDAYGWLVSEIAVVEEIEVATAVNRGKLIISHCLAILAVGAHPCCWRFGGRMAAGKR